MLKVSTLLCIDIELTCYMNFEFYINKNGNFEEGNVFLMYF